MSELILEQLEQLAENGVQVSDECWAFFGADEPKPEVCPEVWNTTKVDPEYAMEMVRSMCKGN
jgi:hypothetical protein